MKHTSYLSAILALPLASHGALTEVHNYSGPSAAIPDGNPSGLANVLTVSGSEILQIQSVKITLNVTGTFNGDLYAYLQHGSDLAIHLFGYGDDGLSITFNDLAANDVHTYQDQVTPGAGNPLTGTWQPDGRAVDPDAVTDEDGRTAMLGSFAGGEANGDWTVFIADMSGGDGSQLAGWSLEVTGVPEPGPAALLVLGTVLLGRRRR